MGLSLTAEYKAVLVRATALGYSLPSASQQILDNAMIVSLKASGDWALLDAFFWAANDGDRNFAKINWKNPSGSLSAEVPTSTSLSWQSGFGFKSGGPTTAWDWGFAPTGGTNYKQNDASYGIYLNTPASIPDIQCFVGLHGNYNFIGGLNGPTLISINGGNQSFGSTTQYSAGSTLAMKRTGSATGGYYVNGTQVQAFTGTSTALDSANFFSFGQNNAGAPQFPLNTAVQIAGQYAGAGTVNQATMHAAMNARALANWTLGSYLSSYTQNKVSISGATTLTTYGDSITSGLNASVAGNRWANKLATDKSLTLTNSGLSGSGVWYALSQLKSITWDNTKVITVMAGFNDIDRNGDAARTLLKIEACYRSMVIAAIRGTQVASGSASVTRTGTITTSLALTYGGINSNVAIPASNAASTSSTIGDNWQWTFTGTGFCVQFIASDGAVATYGTVDIYIDGAVVKSVDLNSFYDGVSDGVYDNKRGPIAYSFHGLSNTSHTIKVQVTSAATVILDFFAPLNSIASTPPMIFAEIPYRQGSTYPLSARDSGTGVIKTIVDEYRALGYNIALAKINTYYNIYNGLSYDSVHPNDTGHAQIESAFLAAIN